MATCKACGKVIKFIKTENGKAMPVDETLITIVTDEGKVVRGRIPHWATCPQANRFRKRSS